MSSVKQLITVSTVAIQDGAATETMFSQVSGILHLPDGRVLVADEFNHRIRLLSAESHAGGMQVSTVAGDGELGHRDGAAAQARFLGPAGLALLPDGRVLVPDLGNHCIRMLSAESHAGGMQVSTVAGNGEAGHRDGAAAQARFSHPTSLALLPDGRVLVSDLGNHRIRMLSAESHAGGMQVSTVAGDGEEGHRDGAAAQARFSFPRSLALLSDGRVLVADCGNHRIRMLSAESHAGGMQVSTVAGDGVRGHRDGAAAQARFRCPGGLALLPDGRVLVADLGNQRIRMLSAESHSGGMQVSTLRIDGVNAASAFEPLPDGRVLVGSLGSQTGIHVLEGFPSAKWLRRRTLLLGLRAAQPPRHKRLARPLCVLQRLAQLPTDLWPSLFQYM